jgi:uncharacterized protein
VGCHWLGGVYAGDSVDTRGYFWAGQVVGLKAIKYKKLILFLSPSPNLKTIDMKKSFLLFFVSSLLFSTVNAQDVYEAVEAKDHAKVESLLKSGEKVNKTNKKNQFPLWIALWNNDVEMVKLLIANGADVNQKFKGKDGKINCLEIACQNGSIEIAKLFVEAGAPVDEKGVRNMTPLRIATRNGRTEIVKYLIEKGADVDAKAEDLATPLEVAAGKGHLEIVQLLVEKGAKINHQDKEGDTPLGEAANSGHVEVVKYLLSKGADVSLKNQKGYTAQDRASLAGQAKAEEVLKGSKN